VKASTSRNYRVSGAGRQNLDVPIKHVTGDSMTMHVRAAPDRIYNLVSDVTRMGEWSPECYRCEWVDGAGGPVVGARFKARNRRKFARWSNKPTVVAATPGEEFAFSRRSPGAGEVIWRFRMSPAGGGTALTESYEVVSRANPLMIWLMLRLLGIRDREADLREAMTRTLDGIRVAGESSG
jgi:hypothetical protein